MPFIVRQEAFTCDHCQSDVPVLTDGGIRNHCTECLHAKHLDDQGPGDRASLCRGDMEPVDVMQRHGEFVLTHRCTCCGKESRNRMAPDDNIDAIIALMREKSGMVMMDLHRRKAR
jgi:hypothetical protein